MARKGAGAPPMDLDDRAESAVEWVQANLKAVVLAVVVVLAIGTGVFLYLRTQAIRQDRAAETLASAQDALAVMNVALAQSDLERVVTRYEGTRAAHQASVLLAQLHFEAGRYQEGLQVLDRAAARPPEYLASSVEALRGAAYEQLGQMEQAAQHYQRAAQRSRFAAEAASHQAVAARIYTQMGNTDQALEIWRELAADPRGPMAAEARLRLGELEAAPASAG
jgi:tetratricopeptide (TPR) repeat protein